MDSVTAQRVLTDHPYYRYRGCAPDVDDPRMAAGDVSVPVDSWQAPDVDGGEEPGVRRAREAAAVEVCVGCPVMVQCLAYGSSLTPEGRLAEEHSILGGLTALERHRQFVEYKREREAVARPEPAPVAQLRTRQKLAVLRALARFEDAEEIADAAGMDVRTAKWQIARLTTQLGLEKTAGRAELLAAAVERGLLDRDEVPDVQAASPEPRVSCPPGRSRRRGGRRVIAVPGQLSFDDVFAPAASAASVTTLFPTTPLEAAA